MTTLGQRVQFLRKQRSWTRRELATRAGLHEFHLSKVEKDLRPHLEANTVVKLACALACTTDYLLGMYEEGTCDI